MGLFGFLALGFKRQGARHEFLSFIGFAGALEYAGEGQILGDSPVLVAEAFVHHGQS